MAFGTGGAVDVPTGTGGAEGPLTGTGGAGATGGPGLASPEGCACVVNARVGRAAPGPALVALSLLVLLLGWRRRRR
jgi:hypothetical protein